MIISALKSNDPKDQRSPIHPDTLSALINTGAEIFFEKGIGDGINTSLGIGHSSSINMEHVYIIYLCMYSSILLVCDWPIYILS